MSYIVLRNNRRRVTEGPRGDEDSYVRFRRVFVDASIPCNPSFLVLTFIER